MNQIMYALSFVVLFVVTGCQQFASNAPKDQLQRVDAGSAAPASRPADDGEATQHEATTEHETEPVDSYDTSQTEEDVPTDSDDVEPEVDDVESDDDDQDAPPSK